MELTEVVSPTVAVPVLCVLVCAFLVFAFGFKSPAQPPSFDVFDEDGKKKRAKKSKGSKGQSNGHAVSAGEGDVNNSATKVQPSPRQTVKQQASKPQTVIAKSKTTSQPAQETTKKSKKQATKEEDQKVIKKPVIEEDVNDVDGWHTVPKKDKKQKKKDNESKQERQDSPVKEEEIVVKSEEPVLAAASANKTEEMPGSPQEQRNKKKKERRNKKMKAEEEVVEQTKVETPVITEVAAPVNIPEPEVIDTNIELQIKDAMETTVNNDEVTVEKKKKSKKDKKKAIEDDFVIPQSAMATKVVTEPVQDLPLKENTEALTVKVAKKKQKKDRNKKNEEKLPESIEIGASGEVESSLSQSSVSDTQPKKTKLKESVKEVPVVIEASIESGASSDTASPGQPTATFDEMGGMTESWTEAKPKSKKKKARRAD